MTVEGFALQRIRDTSDTKGSFHIAMDDRLSRGRDNAQERGIIAEFLHCRAILLHIILIANLGGLWTS